jgi:lysyl endopeptidase
MIRSICAALALASALLAIPSTAATVFRAPALAPVATVSLPAPAEKSVGATVDASGRLRVGFERTLDKALAVPVWRAVAGGFAARIEATSAEAQGLRVKLALGTVPGTMEARVAGADGRVETMRIDPLLGNVAWTPWTEGETQSIELFSTVAPSAGAITVESIVHFTDSPYAKAAAACTLSTACSAQDPTYDAAITERKKSVMRILFQDGGTAFVCSGTLIDTPMRPASFILTANHCINNQQSAASISSLWFNEESTCNSAIPSPSRVQLTGGMSLTFTNFNVDSTLLLMNSVPPGGALYAPLNPALLDPGQNVVSISHPRGDLARYAIGTSGDEIRDGVRAYQMYMVSFSRGIIEGGSSGSGIFTVNSAGHLELRGLLSQGDINLSCSNPTALTLYTRLEVLYPEMAQYIGAAAPAPDDAPNRPQDLFLAPIGHAGLDVPLDTLGTARLDNMHIDYAGDIDVFRFFLTTPRVVTMFSTGSMDTVAALHNGSGVALEANDDANFSRTDNNFGITRRLDPGSYYLSVAAWEPAATGTYGVTLRIEPVDQNFTDLWWNASESGWGLNINHQGNTLFGTLFTYDASHAPMWLVMSNGAKQADGSYQGDLFRVQGTPFNAPAWAPPSATTAVGTMRLVFTSNNTATLTYSVDGTTVTKAITRQVFSTPPTCKWSAFDRAFSFNVQDLWWNPNESGWGVNIAHQGSILFATLFVYGADGKPEWFVMSNGSGNNQGVFTGALYRTTGPVFNASPWSAPTVTQVGTMTFDFSTGNSGQLTYTVDGVQVVKTITRQVFSSPATDCDN